MKSKFGAAFIIFLAAILSGCAASLPQFSVQVSSLSDASSVKRGTYVLLPGMKDVSVADLQFKEYAGYLERALVTQGYERVDDPEKADLAVFLAYGIGDPKTERYTYSLPVWGQTGVRSANTYGSVYSYGNTATYSANTTYTPTYGVTGYTSHAGSYTTYFRFARIDCYDFAAYKKDKKELQIWKTEVTSTGSSGDLRRVLPIMIAGARPYIGTNTGQQVDLTLYENDPEVVRILGVAPSPKR